MIYETDTDLTYLYSGSAWTQISGSTAKGNSGLVYITSSAANTGNIATTISNAFSSTYDAYRIVITDARCSSSAQFIQLQLRGGGTTSTTGYYWTTASAGPSTGTSWSIVNSSNDAFYRSITADSSKYGGGTIEIQNPYLAKETTFQAYGTDARTLGDFLRLASGFHNVTTSYTDLVLNMGNADTWNSGQITVYGYRK